MAEIKSPIGTVQLPEGQKLPTYKVEDPSAQQEAPPRAPQPNLPFTPPSSSPIPQRISVEDYNKFKEFKESTFSVRSTENFDYDKSAEGKLTQEDQQILSFMQGGEAPNREQVMNARKAARKQAAKIKPEIKEKVEILLGLGRKEESIEIDGKEIVLQNLTSKQTKNVLNEMAALAGNSMAGKVDFEQVYVTKHMVVGCALKSVDGVEVSEMLGDEDSDEMREALAEEMDSNVVDKLYNLYFTKIGKNLELKTDVNDEIKKS